MEQVVLKKNENTNKAAGICQGFALSPSSLRANFSGKIADGALFIQEKQLKDGSLWSKFVLQFGRDSDGHDDGWRGEYWGKMMRGACITYSFTRDKSLYSMLEETVINLLKLQDDKGRLSTYSNESEFRGWDMWVRKYVLIGLLYFHSISDNYVLKERIKSAMSLHADYIMDKVGDKVGQIQIADTSDSWKGVNSCSILEPFVLLYKVTGKEKYLSYAKYIVESGGCSGDSLVETALENAKKPHEYPTVKAYEIMSFFTGVLEYYTATGEEKYLKTVSNFVNTVTDNEITIIGCAGCTNELFDNSYLKQTEYYKGEMQETCVSVTWMLLCYKMLRLTGNSIFADYIEKTGYNSILGSINFENNDSYNLINKTYIEPIIFDSYSPLFMNKRGKGVGGFKSFEEGGYYGCCACIGSAGTGLIPAHSVMSADNRIVINFFLNGTINTCTPSGNPLTLHIFTDYPKSGKIKIIVDIEKTDDFSISLRLPAFSEHNTISFDDKKENSKGGCYYTIDKKWKPGDMILLEMNFDVQVLELNGKIAFLYGPIVLARDTAKENSLIDIKKPLNKSFKTGDFTLTRLHETSRELIRIQLEGGNEKVLLTDYASCGRAWPKSEDFLTVWMEVAD